RKIRQLVELRTAELIDVNAALNNEILERRAAEKELKELNDDLEYRVVVRSSEAERRARDLEQFAYVASHDLKAPLRAISNLTDWISEDLEGKLNAESAEQLALLQDRVQRMNALIEGLLEYSRVGRTAGSDSLVDTHELLKEIVDSLSPPKGFTIKLGKELPVFHTDRLLLGQVFSNLISNSLKHHGGKKGRIRIECRKIGQFYEFSVSDDGVGIAPEYHNKVFMIFQTLQAKDYGSNTGIGLALVKKIVEEQGGWITLESQPGKGTLFRFAWPAEFNNKPDDEDTFTFPS
ncbi:MAG TPA: ATP-binding protein, partial [Gammaproteobacteria bacterium]|nr:ATP-binding protein [Gammaproteobacteria bacterium]